MPDNTEITDFYDLVSKSLKRIMDTWIAGEGDITIEVRDDKGQKKAKIKGGPTDRVGGKKQ